MLISQPGALAPTLIREGARKASVDDCLSGHRVRPKDGHLPVRALLAKQLVESKGRPLYRDPV